MLLQGRRLQTEMRGDDVKLLHRELLRLDLPAIPDDEVRQGIFGRGTFQAVIIFQRRHNLPETGRVEEDTASKLTEEISKLPPSPTPPPQPPSPPYVVRGQVRQTDGRALAGISVLAYDRDLRNLELLGEAVTGEDGRYEIRYSPERFRRAEKGRADLVICGFKMIRANWLASGLFRSLLQRVTVMGT